MNFRSQPHLPVEKEKPGTVPRRSSARFQEPYQGTFVKNEEYIKNPRPDGNIYDYYICDRGNHCIFKITPDGNVSLLQEEAVSLLTTRYLAILTEN